MCRLGIPPYHLGPPNPYIPPPFSGMFAKPTLHPAPWFPHNRSIHPHAPATPPPPPPPLRLPTARISPATRWVDNPPTPHPQVVDSPPQKAHTYVHCRLEVPTCKILQPPPPKKPCKAQSDFAFYSARSDDTIRASPVSHSRHPVALVSQKQQHHPSPVCAKHRTSVPPQG